MPTVEIALSDGLCTITLSRPDVANALDDVAAAEMAAAVARAAEDDVTAVVVRGAGARFCAGGDLASMMRSEDPEAYVRALASALWSTFDAIDALRKPVVAIVHGAVAGAGLALMLRADIVLAEAGTVFTAGYSAAGLTPDCGLSYLLPRAIGQPRALDMLLTGRRVTAAEALEWGLVSRLYDGADPSAADKLVGQLARAATLALGDTRALVRESWEAPVATTSQDEVDRIANAIGRPEAQQRIAGFLGKR